MGDHLERDFIGYGGNPPNPNWPNKARLAVNFVLNFEEGSEPNHLDGDGKTETGHTESPVSPVPTDRRDLAAESMFEYGSRAGFWRIHRLFQSKGMPYTVFACALAIERNPVAAAAIKAANLDVCCHGYRWIEHYKLSEAEEREQIATAVQSLKKTLGKAPEGWYCRYGPSENTRRLLLEHGGFLYDSDSYNDDLPYWLNLSGQNHLVVPYSLTNNDGQMTRGNSGNGNEFFQHIKDAFDFLYAEGEYEPKLMNVGLHMRLIGQPARAMALKRFINYVSEFDDVWVAPRVDIARHWAKEHPAQKGL